VDIAIGTAGKSYNLNRVKNYLEKNSLRVDINGLFEGQSRSISKFLSTKHSVKALQIEISLQTRQRPDIDQILIQTAKIFVEDN